MSILLSLLGGAGLLTVLLIVLYNRLVRLRNMVREGWSGIDVQLKRRANLIPNLIETVKGYMGHERDLLEKVTELRSRSMKTDNLSEKQQVESALTGGLIRLFAVAEGYPELKANQNFQDLQKQLSDIEDQIQLARRYYNGTVRNLNIAIESFPGNLVAGWFAFQPAEFFEIEEPADWAVPKVGF
ncbi:MAG: LemA family protein [Desulfosarcina sp.]|nr:LemA family protein [Desulfosarcina sp.]MBC2765702.1 LemA family protein [Desulfosarcina sp.]